MTQDKRVLEYIKTKGSINPLEAWRDCGVYRLSAVVHTLRHEQGIDILTDRMAVMNRFGEECHVAKYTLAE